MADQAWTCICGCIELDEDDNGFSYCLHCGTKVDDVIETGNAEEDFVAKGGDASAAIYSAVHTRQRRFDPTSSAAAIKAEEPISQSNFWAALTSEDPETPARIKTEKYDGDFDDGVGPSGPEDFSWVGTNAPTFEDYHNEIRVRYVMGLQLMLESQCEALVRDFEVSPLICGLVGTLWLRFLAVSRVFDDDWVDEAINESESQQQGEPPEDFKPRHKYEAEPHTMYGQRAVIIWLRSLKKQIPLNFTLAISFLACHVAREPVLSTDIARWSAGGKIPYFSAFVDIEKSLGGPTRACPMRSSLMFRPRESVTAQRLESTAARIAETIGLELPPVNVYAIGSRYLRDLRLPLDAILPHAMRIYEWSMPPDSWLSPNELRLPTRVCVMSILIVAIRIRYNVHGFGDWEKGFSRLRAPSSKFEGTKDSGAGVGPDAKDGIGNPVRETAPTRDPEFDTSKLLHDLEARYNEISENCESSKDLSACLQFCKDVVFAGLEPSFEDHEERKLIDELWDLYQSKKDSKTAVKEELIFDSEDDRKSAKTDEVRASFTTEEEDKMCCDGVYFNTQSSIDGIQRDDQSEDDSQDNEASEQNDLDEATEILRDEAVRRLKIDMEENRFQYIPPRVYPKRFDYLHYTRKRSEGALNYVAHADYYILLRLCAKVAEIEIRLMHMGVLAFERRLAWVEHRISQCLHLRVPSFSCEFCAGNDPVDFLPLSDLNV